MTVAQDQFLEALSRDLAQRIKLAAADDPYQAILDQSRQYQAIFDPIQAAHGASATAAYNQAASELTDHLQAVIRNNPTRTMAEIFDRADVQAALQAAYGDAYQSARASIESAYADGTRIGLRQATSEMDLYGLPRVRTDIPGTTPYLEHVLSDLERNAQSAHGRLAASGARAFGDVPQPASYRQDPGGVTNVQMAQARERALAVRRAVQRETRDLARRAAAGASVIATRALGDAKRAVYQTTAADTHRMIRKIWVCSFRNSCAICSALHGTVVDISDQFPENVTFAATSTRVYEDLQAPPRHPWCGCQLIPFIDETTSQQAALDLKAVALQYATNALGMAPRTFPSDSISALARTTDYMTSADIRTMPESRFQEAIAFFKACVLSFRPKK